MEVVFFFFITPARGVPMDNDNVNGYLSHYMRMGSLRFLSGVQLEKKRKKRIETHSVFYYF